METKGKIRIGNWFERLFGFTESGRASVHKELSVDGTSLHRKGSGERWTCGELEIVSLADLRERAKELRGTSHGDLRLSEHIGDATALHRDLSNSGALFQVASQFNLLEMATPETTPERGITIYQGDHTQGPACAMACAAGTMFRNYFVPVGDQLGQTSSKQIDCLADIGEALGNNDRWLWTMQNGYALPTLKGLREVDSKIQSMSDDERDELMSKLRVGIQWNTQVTLEGCSHLVSQAYCSALPIGYCNHASELWERFARLVLEASYEATFAAALINSVRTGSSVVYLTLIGGGVFENKRSWILDAIQRACQLYRNSALDVRIVSFLHSSREVKRLVQEF